MGAVSGDIFRHVDKHGKEYTNAYINDLSR